MLFVSIVTPCCGSLPASPATGVQGNCPSQTRAGQPKPWGHNCGRKLPIYLSGMPSFAAVDMEDMAQRLAGLGPEQDRPVCASASPAPQAGPCNTTLATIAAETVPATLAAAEMPMQQAEGGTDSCEVADLKQELEAAKMLAHAQQVRVCFHLMHIMRLRITI